ncbi:MAG: hypothetical protein KGR98_02630 [Verrucomicrobia bacterium]|nr:hypothetical protein [Verrucomicrobiota bacterium]MDE3099180.1 hypothetical protein [Verrucomicrobiota bacterium]
MKTYSIRRLEKCLVHRLVDYEINAASKKEALDKLKKMLFEERTAGDEIQEDNWQPLEVLEIVEG